MAGAAAYQRAIEAARAAALGLSRAQEDAFLQLLEQYAGELATRVTAGLATKGEKQALAISREIIQQLTRDMAIATKNGVTLSADRVARMYAEATTALMGDETGVGILGGIGARAAAAVLSRPALAATFKSIQRDSVKAVDRIIHRALLRGASSTEVSRELRLHILGADAFPPELLLDRRRIGYAALRRMGYEPTPANLRLVRQDAGDISGRAQLIARTEPMNAEWEVHRQGAIVSPVVKAIEWRTSRRHEIEDQCDALAGEDLFGLGPGRYDPRMLPRRPHPRCLCLQIDVLFDPEDWGKERGQLPQLQADLDQVAIKYGLAPSQERSFRSVLNASSSGLKQQAGGSGGPKKKPIKPMVPSGAPKSPKAIASQLRKDIAARERQIAPLKVEWATGWDPKTGLQILDKTDNLVDEVSFSPQEQAALKRAILTHNHPSSSSFSWEDIDFASSIDLDEIRVASVRFDYRAQRPAAGWPDWALVKDESRKNYKKLIATFKAQNGGAIPLGDDDLELWHRQWRRTFTKFSIPYRRLTHIP